MTDKTVEVAPKERVEAFYGGVKATSLALMSVLKTKVAVGIITDELAQRIFEETGKYLTDSIDELPEEA